MTPTHTPPDATACPGEGARLVLGDCRAVMAGMAVGSVDLVLADLPYGTTACEWDTIIPLDELWPLYRRVLKPAGAVVLTASQPFTSMLVMSNRAWFKYEGIWEKSSATGFLDSAFRPLKAHENYLVFSPAGCSNGSNPPMAYNPQMTPGEPYVAERRNGIGLASSRTSTLRTTTVSDGLRYPRSVVYIPTETGLHPTQKPVALMEYLIRTYSNPGDTVLDNTMGSGTTGVACVQTGRRFIGIELDPAYIAIAQRRIADARLRLERPHAPPLRLRERAAEGPSLFDSMEVGHG